MTQLVLDFDAARCEYGTDGPGADCALPATHAAVTVMEPYTCGCWGKAGPAAKPGHRARRRCCRPHADYYASAWARPFIGITQACPHAHEATWIDVLEVAA